MHNGLPQPTDREILAARSAKQAVDPRRPQAFLVEQECAANGQVIDVATLFLTNRECPFRCLMCDLWKHTTDQPVLPGDIPEQIDHGLSRLPPARQIKLYNSGNFFDARAIPPADLPVIAERVRGFENVIVENHPRLCTAAVPRFQHLLEGTPLEMALGLETIHPEILPQLNKQMTLDDFARAVEFLLDLGITVRCFVLLKPPFLNEEAGMDWALRSVDHAFALGVGCCSVIPTRGGNGILERLQAEQAFAPPRLSSLELVQEQGLRRKPPQGRLFVDLWDIERFATCSLCLGPRRERMHRMNLSQEVLPLVPCVCREASA